VSNPESLDATPAGERVGVCRHGDFVDLCRRKGGEPTYRVGLVDALAGGQPDPAERWGVSRVLSRWGVELLAVDLTS